MNRRHSLLAVCVLLLANVVVSRLEVFADDEPQSTLKRYDFEEVHMGVDFNIRLYAAHAALANKAAKAAFARIEQLNKILSDYESSSEVRKLCDMPSGKPERVSRDLFRVLDASQRLSKSTKGAFDVTVGPLTKLWRRARRRYKLPDQKLLAEARKAVGFKAIVLDSKAQTVRITRPNLRIDLGGIAKGYAVDEALKTLATFGITEAIVDGSGDIAIGDPPPGRKTWIVSVGTLNHPDSESAATLSLKNCAVATSGDAFQAVEIEGKRYSHIVDPKTGLGLTLRSSVTIIAPTGMLADGLASAVSVLGPEAGIEFVNKTQNKNCEALVLSAPSSNKTPVSVQRHQSRSFDQFINRPESKNDNSPKRKRGNR